MAANYNLSTLIASEGKGASISRSSVSFFAASQVNKLGVHGVPGQGWKFCIFGEPGSEPKKG